jgi:hypothetical protein
MINEKHPILNIQLNKKLSRLKQFYKDFMEGLFALFCLMLDDPLENFWYECISMSLGYFQLLIYIIDETVRQIIILFNYKNSFGQFGIKML